MKKLYALLALCCTGCWVVNPAFATVNKTAQTGIQFLKVDMSARAAAMGSSYLMVGDDATAMFYNPAGLAKMTSGFDFFVNQTQWLADITYNAGALAKSFGNLGTFGISYMAADYGDDIVGTVYNGDDPLGYTITGNLDVGAYALGLSYAKAMTDKFAIGGQVKYVSQNLGENTLSSGNTVKNEVDGVAYDFGTVFYPGFKSFRLGMAIRNFSPEFKYVEEGFELPLTFILGFAMDVLDFLGEHENQLLVAIDATHPRDYTERVHVGAEYLFMDMIALRAGYKFNYDVEGFSAGAGFKKDLGGIKVGIDYAFSDSEFFDSVNRLSVGISF